MAAVSLATNNTDITSVAESVDVIEFAPDRSIVNTTVTLGLVSFLNCTFWRASIAILANDSISVLSNTSITYVSASSGRPLYLSTAVNDMTVYALTFWAVNDQVADSDLAADLALPDCCQGVDNASTCNDSIVPALVRHLGDCHSAVPLAEILPPSLVSETMSTSLCANMTSTLTTLSTVALSTVTASTTRATATATSVAAELPPGATIPVASSISLSSSFDANSPSTILLSLRTIASDTGASLSSTKDSLVVTSSINVTVSSGGAAPDSSVSLPVLDQFVSLPIVVAIAVAGGIIGIVVMFIVCCIVRCRSDEPEDADVGAMLVVSHTSLSDIAATRPSPSVLPMEDSSLQPTADEQVTPQDMEPSSGSSAPPLVDSHKKSPPRKSSRSLSSKKARWKARKRDVD
jgi:hypothetical protein